MKNFGNESGQTLVMVALSLGILLGFAAFATDIGVMLHEKRVAQSAADSAAIAAASAMSFGGDATASGLAAAANNGFTAASNCAAGSTYVCIQTDSSKLSGYFYNKAGYVEAIVSRQTPVFFLRAKGWSGMTVSAKAVATDLGTADGCMYILNPGKVTPAAHPWGKSTLTMPGCGILVDGEIDVGGNGTVNARSVAATGKIDVSGSGNILGSQSAGVMPFSDPYKYLKGSDYLPKTTSPCLLGDGTTTCTYDQPLTNSSTGVYVYDKAVTFSGTINAKGVTIILLPTASFGTANASVTLTPPSSGPFANVLISAPNYTGELNLDFGMSTVNLSGVIYAPQADLSLQDQGGHSADLVLNADLILGTLDVGNKDNGNLTLNRYIPPSGVSPMPKISLVE